MRALVLLVCCGLSTGAAAAENYDVPFFQANPRMRARVLRECADDAAKNRTPICENARAAATRGNLGRPLPSAPTQFERDLPAYLRRS